MKKEINDELISKVNIVLGTMQFGERVFGEDATNMVECFGQHGYTELDTAYVYNDGESEKLVGKAINNLQPEYTYKVATKVNPRITGKLNKEAVISQFEESLRRMCAKSVDILYLHFPDPETPVENALEGCAKLYNEGKFRKLGLSNFPAWMVAEVYYICEKYGWMLPKVYEGLYNPLSRHAERELDKALDNYGIRFYAYNPLAGGLLTDKYKDGVIIEGRFVNRPNYKSRYWHESYFVAVNRIRASCEKYGISIMEATYRWIAFHSMLKVERGDGVIIGASNIRQLKQNLVAFDKGKLPDEIREAIDECWDICRHDAPEYFKFYQPQK